MARRLRIALGVGQAWMGCARSLYVLTSGPVTGVALLILGVLGWGPGAYGLDPALDVSQYAHTAWKIREGFTKGTIFSTAQTPDGYLWLGTEFGLVRFDGVQAIPWQPPGGEQLPSSWINALLVTRDGTLWIGTEKGLASWKDGKLTEYPEVAGLSRYFTAARCRRNALVWGQRPRQALCRPSRQDTVLRSWEFGLVRTRLIRGPQRQSVGVGSSGSVAMGAWTPRALPVARWPS